MQVIKHGNLVDWTLRVVCPDTRSCRAIFDIDANDVEMTGELFWKACAVHCPSCGKFIRLPKEDVPKHVWKKADAFRNYIGSGGV